MTRRLRLLEAPVPIHLLVGPLAPPLMVLALSSEFAPPMPSVWFVAGIWGAVLALVAGLTCITRNVRTSAAVVALVLLAFFVDFATAGVMRTVPVFSLAIWIVVAVIGVMLIRRRREAPGLTVFANVLFVSVSLGSCGQIAFLSLLPKPAVKPERSQVSGSTGVSRVGTRPDIYVFVLDGYARADVLKRLYRYDDAFVPRLRDQGFYVADLASSNYAQTALSLASSLNLDYLPALIDGIPSDAASRVPCRTLMTDNRTFRILRDAGYRTATFASEYSMLRFANVDHEYDPPLYLTDFGVSFFHAGVPTFSRLVGLPPAWLPHQIRRRHILWTFEQLAHQTLSAPDRPTFVFAHILLPHPPFVFRADGSYTWTTAQGMQDGDHWRAGQDGRGETYEAGYVAQLRFLADQLPRIVHDIFARARRPTAVLIQGDHGSGSRLVWDTAAASDMNERLGILLAVKFSGGNAANPYPTMTPVNAMRLLLNDALGTNMPLLEDRAWFSTWSRPYRFIDATDRVRRHPE